MPQDLTCSSAPATPLPCSPTSRIATLSTRSPSQRAMGVPLSPSLPTPTPRRLALSLTPSPTYPSPLIPAAFDSVQQGLTTSNLQDP